MYFLIPRKVPPPPFMIVHERDGSTTHSGFAADVLDGISKTIKVHQV